MRVALLDPPGYTPQYDDRLAAALAARGHAVDLLTARFLHGELPEAVGYTRHEVAFRLSARLFADRPRSRLRLPVKALEYAPSMWALRRRVDADVAHFQWLARPGLDLRWLRRLSVPKVYTAHNVTLRQGPEKQDEWREILAAFAGVVVHSNRGVERLAALGVERDRIARIPHPAFDGPAGELTEPTGRTLLFFGLIREHKGLDVLIRALPEIPDARLVVAGDEVDPVAPLRDLAAGLGVADRIEWRLGYLPAGRGRRADARRDRGRPAAVPARATPRACSPPRSATGGPASSRTWARSARRSRSSVREPSSRPATPGRWPGPAPRFSTIQRRAAAGAREARKALTWEGLAAPRTKRSTSGSRGCPKSRRADWGGSSGARQGRRARPIREDNGVPEDTASCR